MSKPEIYVSIDIESDGAAPGVNSMLALGAAAFTEDGQEHSTWYSTIEALPDAYQDTSTMDWWTTQPEAWLEVITNPVPPQAAMDSFVAWLKELKQAGFKPIAVGWPIAFDFAFVNYYCHRFCRENPLGFSGLDIRSFANGLFGFGSYYAPDSAEFKKVRGTVNTEGLRSHIAVDDAIEQGRLFMALRAVATRH